MLHIEINESYTFHTSKTNLYFYDRLVRNRLNYMGFGTDRFRVDGFRGDGFRVDGFGVDGF